MIKTITIKVRCFKNEAEIAAIIAKQLSYWVIRESNPVVNDVASIEVIFKEKTNAEI